MRYKIINNDLIETNKIEPTGLFFVDISIDGEDAFQDVYVNLAKELQNHSIRLESHIDEDIICLPDIVESKDAKHPLFVIVRKNQMIFLADKEMFTTFLKKMVLGESNHTAANLLNKVLHEISNLSYANIGKIEENILALEDKIISNPIVENSSKEILLFRRQLLLVKRGFNEILDVVDYLIENDSQYYSKEEIKRFTIAKDRLDRNYNYVLALLEYVTEVREAYQSQVDMRQNDIMRLFTIISAIFLPLTLLVGWYGMNFRIMPELEWVHGYPTIIILSIIIVVFCVYYFKKNKWF